MALKDFWQEARVVWVSSSHPGAFTTPGRLYVTITSPSRPLCRTYCMDEGWLVIPGPAYLKRRVAAHVARLEAEALAAPVHSTSWSVHQQMERRRRRRARGVPDAQRPRRFRGGFNPRAEALAESLAGQPILWRPWDFKARGARRLRQAALARLRDRSKK
ncbi:MAG: hypothetical protein ABIQ16_05665 [Polyangiaceae bacterium]